MSANKKRGKGKGQDDKAPDDLRADRETNYGPGSWIDGGPPAPDDLRADRETNYAQGSLIGGGYLPTGLSAERLAGAFASDPDRDPPNDHSWRSHKLEEDDPPQPSDDSHDAKK